ncbi:MAG: Cys-Gln thioester bond-forming surface protein [Bacilli bacterium]|nr:Cys-Gln thioester bond-forming surface protein [Bacilli bacterium]
MIKKILLVLFGLFLIPLCIKADSSKMFFLDLPIPGVYTLMDKGYKKAANYVKVIRRKSDNAFVYCVMPGVAINAEEVYNAYETNQWSHLNVSEKTWEKINLIAYYGYQYDNHQDLEWYAVTQYLIWLEVLPDGWDVYFTDKLRGEKINKYDDKINEILALVNNYYLNPTVSQNIELDYLETRRIIDYNNVLNNYELITNNNVSVNSNYLYLNNVIDDFSFKLRLKTEGIAPILYKYDGAQSVITRGTLPSKELTYNVHVKKGQIRLLKKSIDNAAVDFKSPLISLQGAKYAIYNDSFYQEFNTDSNGVILTDYLKVGKYYIKEISPSLGYELDETIYQIEVSDGAINEITVWEKPIVMRLNIKKYYNDWDNLILENNALFGIYDLEDNLLIKKETNSNGELTFKIPYGDYKIKQIAGKVGYKLADEIIISVTESLIIDKTILNEPVLSQVTVKKFDENNELIKNMSFQFKIYDVKRNCYILYENKEIFKFAENGQIILPIKLPFGTYIIEELEEDNDYYETGVKKEFIIDESNNDKVEIVLINKEKRYNINILKKQEISHEETKILAPGIDIKFCLYANEDIFKSKDLIYSKNELIQCQITNKDAIASFSNLWYGNYYFLEDTSEDYKPLEPIEVIFSGLNNNLEIINYLKEKESIKEVLPEEEIVIPEGIITPNINDSKTEIIIPPIIVSKPEEVIPEFDMPKEEVSNPQTGDSFLKCCCFLKVGIFMMILGIFMLNKPKKVDFLKKIK